MYRLLYAHLLVMLFTSANASFHDFPDYAIESFVNAKNLPFTEDELIAFQVNEVLAAYPRSQHQKLSPIVKSRIIEQFDILRKGNATLILWNTLENKSILGMAWLESSTGLYSKDAFRLRYATCLELGRYDRFLSDLLSSLPLLDRDRKFLLVKLPRNRSDWNGVKPTINPMLVEDEFLGKQGIEWLAYQFVVPSS